MSKDTETLKHDAEVAQFRFALIAPVIHGVYPDTSATACYKQGNASPLDLCVPFYEYKILRRLLCRQLLHNFYRNACALRNFFMRQLV